MIDIHAHFADEGYEFPEEWKQIKAAGVNTVVLAGDTIAHSKMHRDFCKEHAGAYFCAGVHPLEATGFGEDTVEELRTLCRDEKCIAIGEIGLDYHYPTTHKKPQLRAFEAQLVLADEEGLPVQIHARDCFEDALRFLKSHRELLRNGFLLHCYSFGAEHIAEFAKLGAYFSFGGVTCFKNAPNVVESVKACPMDRILSETDSPYLSPLRGEKNTPANIPLIVEKIAQIKGVETEEMCRIIRENAVRLFPKLKLNTYTYQIGNNLYINLTNRCTNRCTFCVREGKTEYEGYSLWLKEEPTVAQVIAGIGDPKKYDEIVFCGFGEPTHRLDVMLEICAYVHSRGGRTRLNTNGHGSLINGINIAPLLKGNLDTVNVSLNAPSEEEYNAVCRPQIAGAYKALLDFARSCRESGVNALFSVVDCIGKEAVEQCKKIAGEVGLPLRVREMIE